MYIYEKYHTARIDALKKLSFRTDNDPWMPSEIELLKNAAYAAVPRGMSHNVFHANVDAYLLDNYPLALDPDDLLVGRFAENFSPTEEQKRLAKLGGEARRLTGALCCSNSGATGHRVIDYEKLLNKGIDSVLDEIAGHRAALDTADPEWAAKLEFYESAEISLRSVLRFAARVRSSLLALAESENSPRRKKELLRMAANFESAPAKPCRHFYEALQTMWFMQFCLKLVDDISLTGRFDNYMYPFYRRDIDDGYTTDAEVYELIECLYLKHNEIYTAWPASVMVGGVDRDGNPVWNELTRMCVEAIRTTGLVNPSVNVSYTDQCPQELLDVCVDIISEGYTRPALFNDRVIQRGLRAAGMSERDSRYYIHSTCVEITPVAASNVNVATPYININKAFEYILHGGKATFGDALALDPRVPLPESMPSTFGEFKELAKTCAAAVIRASLKDVLLGQLARERYTSSPLASCFINDCLGRGSDAVAGGARYSYVYPCFPGYLNFVDSLAAIKRAVYDEKIVSFDELCASLAGNFSEDGERLRQYLRNRCPKFGTNDDDADSIAVEIYDFIREELSHYRSSVGGTFHPSYFAWIMHGILGSRAGATPDGRSCGAALSESLSSVQGMDKNGPTGVLNSIAKIDQKYGIGGIATNVRLSRSFLSTEKGRASLKSYIRSFMDRDCFELQFNVVDQKTLIDAKAHPENYRTLMVRVAGYSDYFVNLLPVIQDEVISRSEHDNI